MANAQTWSSQTGEGNSRDAHVLHPFLHPFDLCSRRTVAGRRQPPTSNFGLFPPKTGHERMAPSTHKPGSQELISPWSQVRIPPHWTLPLTLTL